MRVINKTYIQFSLLSIPIALFKAVEKAGISFKQIHANCGELVGRKDVCKGCGETVPRSEILKGWEHTKDEYLEIDPTDLERETTITNIPVVHFTDQAQVDPRYLNGDLHYIAPQKGGEELYGLFVGALIESGKVAVCRYALRGKERYGMLVKHPLLDTLCLYGMRFTDEVRKAPDLSPDGHCDPSSDEFKLSVQLIKKQYQDFDPKQFEDEQSKKIYKYLLDKKAGKKVVSLKSEPQQRDVSIKDTLRQSLKIKRR